MYAEAETDALGAWITSLSQPCVTSEIAQVEVLRACRRVNKKGLPAASQLLSGLDLVPVTRAVVGLATTVGSPALHGVAGIHLASALSIRSQVTSFVTYDRVLRADVVASGIRVFAPA